ncbi:MAG: glycosyltransferase family 2 protein [Desulfobacterales bacterium]|nr:glycosyltransferase family 2 protein [Desulfobacterales bacterium]
MRNSNLLVSVGLPVYNGASFINQAVDSLLAQDYKDFELIISDNASTDRTQEICLEYAEQDKRVRYYRSRDNMGASWNFNHVFELSTGEYFMWASHDDYWEPSYISACIKAYEFSPDIILAGAFCESFDTQGENASFIDFGLTTIGLPPQDRFIQYKKSLHSGCSINGVFHGIYKSKFLSKAMPMKKVIANDHLILAELSLQGEFKTVEKKLIHKRWGGGSESHRNNARTVGINNELLIRFPYFMREILLQKIIIKTDNIFFTKKIWLSCWSLWNYILFSLKLNILISLVRIKNICSFLKNRSIKIFYLFK